MYVLIYYWNTNMQVVLVVLLSIFPAPFIFVFHSTGSSILYQSYMQHGYEWNDMRNKCSHNKLPDSENSYSNQFRHWLKYLFNEMSPTW